MLKDDNNNKCKQCHHFCRCKYKEMYEKWKCDNLPSLNLKKTPCLNYFMNLKPCHVYKTKQGDFSACMVCYNTEKMLSALVKIMSNNHEFAFNVTIMRCMRVIFVLAFNASNTVTLIALKIAMKLLQYLCCNNDYKYPNLSVLRVSVNKTIFVVYPNY